MRHICYSEMPQREFNNFKVANTCSLGPEHRDAIETGRKKSRKIPQCRNEINQTPSADVKNLSVLSASHQRYLRVDVVYPCRVCFQTQQRVPSRVALCRRSRVLCFVVSIRTSHLQGNTSSFLGFYSRIFRLFFPSAVSAGGSFRRIHHPHAPCL